MPERHGEMNGRERGDDEPRRALYSHASRYHGQRLQLLGRPLGNLGVAGSIASQGCALSVQTSSVARNQLGSSRLPARMPRKSGRPELHANSGDPHAAQKARCAGLAPDTPTSVLTSCVDGLLYMSEFAESMQLEARKVALRWRPVIVWASRAALVLVVFSALILCFLGPVWSIHRSMEDFQQERDELLSDEITKTEKQLAALQTSADEARIVVVSKRLADLQKEAVAASRIVWPFDRAILAKATIPQLVTAGWGLAKVVWAL